VEIKSYSNLKRLREVFCVLRVRKKTEREGNGELKGGGVDLRMFMLKEGDSWDSLHVCRPLGPCYRICIKLVPFVANSIYT